jgi:hypothetical protein
LQLAGNQPAATPSAANAEAVIQRPAGGGGSGGSGGTDVATAISKLSTAIDKLTNIADAHEKLLADHEQRIKNLENPMAAPNVPKPMPKGTTGSGS